MPTLSPAGAVQRACNCLKCITSGTVPYHLMCVSIQLAFSGWHVVARVTMAEGANPLVFAAYREVISTALMYGLCFVKGYGLSGIHRSDVPRIIATGFFSFINVVGALVALSFVSADRFAVLQPTIPVWATLLSICVGIEPLRLLKLGAVLLAVVGAIVVEVGPEDSDQGMSAFDEYFGTLVTVAQCIATAVVLILSKPLTKKYPPTVVTCAYYTVGSFFTMLVVVANAGTLKRDQLFFHGEKEAWGAVAYATVVATFYAYNAWSQAVKYLSPSIATVYCTMQPLGTAILSIFVFNILPGIPEYVGGFLVVSGLLLSVAAEQHYEINEKMAGKGSPALEMRMNEVKGLLEADLEALDEDIRTHDDDDTTLGPEDWLDS